MKTQFLELCSSGECLYCDAIRVRSFDAFFKALKLYKDYRDSGLAGRASKQARAARAALHHAVAAAFEKVPE